MARSRRAYEFCGMTIASDHPLPDLRRGVPANAQCVITSGLAPLARPPESWFHEWRLPGGGLWLAIGRVPGGYLLRFPAQADFVVSADGSQIAVHARAGLAEETRRHLLIDQVLPLALSRRGRLALHASAVHLPGLGTVGFVGATGRGKSTLAATLAARGGRIMTDDCLAIDLVQGVAHAAPGYPGLRLWPGVATDSLVRAGRTSRVAHYSAKRRLHGGSLPFHGQPSPLRLLFLLSSRAGSGPPLSIRTCRTPARLIGLLRGAYVLDVEDRATLTELFAGLARLVTTVPVVRLRLRDGHRRLPAAADMICEYAASVARPGPGSGAALSA